MKQLDKLLFGTNDLHINMYCGRKASRCLLALLRYWDSIIPEEFAGCVCVCVCSQGGGGMRIIVLVFRSGGQKQPLNKRRFNDKTRDYVEIQVCHSHCPQCCSFVRKTLLKCLLYAFVRQYPLVTTRVFFFLPVLLGKKSRLWCRESAAQ